MRLGDIKIEAIKLMFVNYSFDIGIEDLQRLIGDENYGSYIVNMTGSINRAIDRIQNALVVPQKTHKILDNELVNGKHFDRFNLSQIDDLYTIDIVVAEDGCGGYNNRAEYRLEGNTVVLNSGLQYSIVYYPSLKVIDDTVGNLDEIYWLPEHIARLIPYFIKGELYQEEEPALAADARNIFEASLEDLKEQPHGNQARLVQIIRRH